VLHTVAYWLMLTTRNAIPEPQPLATAESTTRVRIALAGACSETELLRGVVRSLQLAGR